DQFANPFRRHFAYAACHQVLLDPMQSGVHPVRADRAFAQRQLNAGAQLSRVEINPAPVPFLHSRQAQLDPLVRGETTVTLCTAATTTNRTAIIGLPRLDDLGIVMLTERTLHAPPPLVTQP